MQKATANNIILSPTTSPSTDNNNAVEGDPMDLDTSNTGKANSANKPTNEPQTHLDFQRYGHTFSKIGINLHSTVSILKFKGTYYWHTYLEMMVLICVRTNGGRS